MNVYTSKKLYLGYLNMNNTLTDECVVEADNVSDAIKKAEVVFIEKYPVLKDGGYGVSVEKAVGCSDTVEPDYHGVTS